jgi:iron complex outermembrane receptor protein
MQKPKMRATFRRSAAISTQLSSCALLLLSSTVARAADSYNADIQLPAGALVTQNNPPKTDTAEEISKESVSTNTKRNAKPAALEEVIVTGSRLPVVTRDTSQDVKIYPRQQMDESGQTTLSGFLNTLPDVSVSTTENSFQTIGGSTTVQLHGLPIGTTLILVNGRRVETSGAAQFNGLTYFDLNTIPLAAIDHIELISQGSSAVYGSDAIAGVINVVLKKSFEGFAVNARYGGASGTDEADADISYGHRWDHGHVTVVGSYQTRSELPAWDRTLTNDQDYRPYGGRNANLFTCPDRANIYSINGAKLPGIPASYAGVPANYTGPPSQEEFLPTAGILNQCSVFRYISNIAGTDRAGASLEGAFDLSPSVEIYSDVLFSHVEQSQYAPPPILFGQPGFQVYTVSPTNPFNPFGETVGVSDMVATIGRTPQGLTTNYLNAVLGGRGSLSEKWTWDLAVSDSQDKSYLTAANLQQATLQAGLNSSNSTTALNPFIAGPLGPPQILQSLTAQDRWDFLGRTTAVNGVIRGTVLTLPAGPLQLALGGNYQRDTLFQNANEFPGPPVRTDFHRDSYALFGETRLPILGGTSGSQSDERVALTVAGRFDHYSDFGDQWTPQLGLEWRPYRPLLIRATYSRSFRAPDLIDLYATQSTTIELEVIDPLRGNATEVVTETTGGNPNLQPETGTSKTVGVVYSSESLDDLRVAITYWSTDVENWIQQLPAQVIIDNSALFPGAVTRATSCQGSPPCPITSVTATYLNFGELSVAGLDYQFTARHETQIGTFSPFLAATQTIRYTTSLTPGSPSVEVVSVGQDSGNWAPRWKGSVGLKWQNGAWLAVMQGRYTSKYQDYDSTREIGNFWLVDVNGRFAIGQAIGAQTRFWQKAYISIGAVNLFNKLPQFSNFESGIVGFDPSQADIRGRFLYAQVGTGW